MNFRLVFSLLTLIMVLCACNQKIKKEPDNLPEKDSVDISKKETLSLDHLEKFSLDSIKIFRIDTEEKIHAFLNSNKAIDDSINHSLNSLKENNLKGVFIEMDSVSKKNKNQFAMFITILASELKKQNKNNLLLIKLPISESFSAYEFNLLIPNVSSFILFENDEETIDAKETFILPPSDNMLSEGLKLKLDLIASQGVPLEKIMILRVSKSE